MNLKHQILSLVFFTIVTFSFTVPAFDAGATVIGCTPPPGSITCYDPTIPPAPQFSASSCVTYSMKGAPLRFLRYPDMSNYGAAYRIYPYSNEGASTVFSIGGDKTFSVVNQSTPSILQKIRARFVILPADARNNPANCPYVGDISLFVNGFSFTPQIIQIPGAPVTPPPPGVNYYSWDDGVEFFPLYSLVNQATLENLIVDIDRDKEVKMSIQKDYDSRYSPLDYNNYFSPPMTNCQKISGNGPRKVVFMRGQSWNSNINDYLLLIDDVINNGFKKIDPFKTYADQFSFYVDLKKYDDSWASGLSDFYDRSSPNSSDIKLASSCTSSIGNADQYLFYTSKTFGDAVSDSKGFASFNVSHPDLLNGVKITDPIVAIHETAHGFAGLLDEYTIRTSGALSSRIEAFLNGSTFGKNCTSNPTWDYRSSLDNKVYGSVVYEGCTYLLSSNSNIGKQPKTYYRPSRSSIMKTEPIEGIIQNDKFNVISCGYIVAAIKGEALIKENAQKYWPECKNTLDTTLQDMPSLRAIPTVNSITKIAKTSLNLHPSIFARIFNIAKSALQATVGASNNIYLTAGDSLTISGSGFTEIDNSAVLVSTVNPSDIYEVLNIASPNQTSISVEVPKTVPAGAYSLKIGAFNSSWSPIVATLSVAEYVAPRPTITAFNHPSAAVGSWIIVTGSGFSTSTTANTDKVEFSGAGPSRTMVAGISASRTGDFYIDPTRPNLVKGQYTAFQIPATTTPGTYTVKIANQDSPWSNSLSFTVLPLNNPDGTYAYNPIYAIASQSPPPVYVSVSMSNAAGTTTPILNTPSSVAEVSAGQQITVRGSNFSPTGNKVQLTTPNLERPRNRGGGSVSTSNNSKANLAAVGALAAVTSSTTTSTITWEITDIPSTDGSSITFTLPSDMPTAVFNLKAAASNSGWSNVIPVEVASRKTVSTIAVATESVADLQVFVVAGENESGLVLNPPVRDGYVYWIKNQTLLPPTSSQNLFYVTQSGVTLSSGIVDGIMIDKPVSTGQVVVKVPRLSGYDISGYIYRTPVFSFATEDRGAYQPVSLFVNSGIGASASIVGASADEYYFSFPLVAEKFNRLVIFYKKLPVVCRNITFDLIEEKVAGQVNFRLSGTPTMTALDISHLVAQPYTSDSDVAPDYIFETHTNTLATQLLNAFNLYSGRFSIVEYKTIQYNQNPQTTGGGRGEISKDSIPVVSTTVTDPADGIIETDVALVQATVPFNQNIRSIVARDNATPPKVTRIPVGPFPTQCPAICRLEFETLDFNSASGQCCAGLSPVELGDTFVCQKI